MLLGGCPKTRPDPALGPLVTLPGDMFTGGTVPARRASGCVPYSGCAIGGWAQPPPRNPAASPLRARLPRGRALSAAGAWRPSYKLGAHLAPWLPSCFFISLPIPPDLLRLQTACNAPGAKKWGLRNRFKKSRVTCRARAANRGRCRRAAPAAPAAPGILRRRRGRPGSWFRGREGAEPWAGTVGGCPEPSARPPTHSSLRTGVPSSEGFPEARLFVWL